MDAALSELCAQSVLVEMQTGVSNAAGKPVYAAPLTFACRLENKTDYRMTSTGDVVKTSGHAYLVPNGSTVPRVGIDRITLPVTELVRQPPIVDVTVEVDEYGNLDHIVVYF